MDVSDAAAFYDPYDTQTMLTGEANGDFEETCNTEFTAVHLRRMIFKEPSPCISTISTVLRW